MNILNFMLEAEYLNVFNLNNNRKIVLDFSPSLHGHFLEYIVNVYIFGLPKIENIFNSSGAAHVIDTNKPYQRSKVVHGNHYSIGVKPYPSKLRKLYSSNATLHMILLVSLIDFIE
jgi:hypothetical protein